MTAIRSPNDFYPTPPWCYEKLDIDYTKFKTALEPCRGDGRIFNFLVNKGLDTKYAEISEGIDYLTTTFEPVDLILTNPPFSIAQEFIQKAVGEAEVVIMLLRLNFLGSQKRNAFWKLYPQQLYMYFLRDQVLLVRVQMLLNTRGLYGTRIIN